jgi:hypothetical protein
VTDYQCLENPSHGVTDQREWIGCRRCWIEKVANNTERFFGAHLAVPGTSPVPFRSDFTYDQINSRITFAENGTVAELNGPLDWLTYVTAPSRCTWQWNSKHRKLNLLVPKVGWGATGSGTTLQGRPPRTLSGLLVADVLNDPHAFPVDPRGYAVKDLTPYASTCSCGGMKRPGDRQCAACGSRLSD